MKTAKKVYEILHVSLWMHGIGLITVGVSQRVNCLKIVLSICFALFIDGIMVYHLLAVYIYHNYIVKNVIDVAIETCFFILGLTQRCIFYYRQKNLISILTRLSRLHSPIFSNRVMFKWKLIAVILLSDVMIVIILIAYLSPVVFSSNARISHTINVTNIMPDEFSYIREFCVFWKKMNMCVAIYFCAICFMLKETLSVLRKCAKNVSFKHYYLISAYNELLDITEETNKNFSLMLLLSIVMSVFSVFYHAYNYVFKETDPDHIKIFRILVLIYRSFCFLIICFSASSVSNHALEAKYEIEKAENEFSSEKECYHQPKFNSHNFEFTILDSIVIDRSLIFTVTGVLLTYGVMIATFSMSSM